MPPSPGVVGGKLNAIEAEMKRIGMWQAEALPAEKLDFQQAFGMDTMAFEQWLQFVFIARVRERIAEGGGFPTGSEVAAQAFREWKMWGAREDVEGLLELLREFDALFS